MYKRGCSAKRVKRLDSSDGGAEGGCQECGRIQNKEALGMDPCRGLN